MVFGWIKSKFGKNRVKKEDNSALINKQKVCAKELYNTLLKASRDNTIYDIYSDGTKERDNAKKNGTIFGPIQTIILGSDDNYKVIVGLKDSSCNATLPSIGRGHLIVEVTFSIKGDIGEINVYYGYDKEENYSIDEFNTLLVTLKNYVREYRHFK